MRSFPVDIGPRRRRFVVEQRLSGRREVRILPETARLQTASLQSASQAIIYLNKWSAFERTLKYSFSYRIDAKRRSQSISAKPRITQNITDRSDFWRHDSSREAVR